MTPAQLLTAAGLPLTSTTDRQITVTYRVLVDGRTRVSTTRTLAVGPSDGTYAEATAPDAPPTVGAGHPVTVSYDLTGVASTSDRSSWCPRSVTGTRASLPVTAGWHQALTAPKGTVTIPAEASRTAAASTGRHRPAGLRRQPAVRRLRGVRPDPGGRRHGANRPAARSDRGQRHRRPHHEVSRDASLFTLATTCGTSRVAGRRGGVLRAGPHPARHAQHLHQRQRHPTRPRRREQPVGTAPHAAGRLGCGATGRRGTGPR
ncbi:hypothetical protein E4K10_40300 [Streptomyces sp. T1317-0309]|nr:hypothetical protein E4K10_40300 [Streptomyces sp. T1317-0309]